MKLGKLLRTASQLAPIVLPKAVPVIGAAAVILSAAKEVKRAVKGKNSTR